MSSIHVLKCHPGPFEAVRAGRKAFEYRFHDRNYQLGDLLVLQEYNPELDSLSGEATIVRVVYLLAGGQFGVPEKYCVMSIEPVNASTEAKCFHVEAWERCTRYLEGSSGERAAVVAWLRTLDPSGGVYPLNVADMVEKGWHVGQHPQQIEQRRVARVESVLDQGEDTKGA